MIRRVLRPYVQRARGWAALGRAEQSVRRNARLGGVAVLRRLPLPSTALGPPSRAVGSIDDWVASTPDVRLVRLRPAERLPVPAPVTVQPFVVPSRPWLRAEEEGGLSYETAAQYVVEIPGARVLGREGGVISSRDELLLPLSPEIRSLRRVPGHHDVTTRLRLPPMERVRGRVAVLATPGDGYFGHWMLELIPRIALLRAAGFDPAELDGVYLRGPRARYEIESLQAAGVPLDRIIDSGAHPHVRADVLVVPSPLRDVYEATDLSCDYLNSLFVETGGDESPSRRLFVSRRSATHRRIVNEDEILSALHPLGFELLLPETQTLREQSAVFARAEAVVSPQGSTMAALVYCRPGTAVVEIQNPRSPVSGVMTIAARRGARYGIEYGTGVDSRANPLEEDMRVDVARLLKVLEAVGIG